MKRLISFLDPLLVIGVLVSIILALILVLTGVDTVDSLLVGLAITIMTLIIDSIARSSESEKRITQSILLGNLVTSDQELYSIISLVTKNYLSVKEGWFDLYKQRADDELNTCKDTIQALANGYLVVEPTGKYAFGKKGVELADYTVKAVSYEPMELWRTTHWKKSIEVNADAVKRGVKITRVFVQDESELSKYYDVLEAHKKTGASVFMVSPSGLPTNLLESFFIIDDRILAEFHLTLEGQLKEERISINPIEVDKAISGFNYIMRHAHEYQKEPQSK